MQTKSYADADGIHTKNNMSPTPSEGGHNKIVTFNSNSTYYCTHSFKLSNSQQIITLNLQVSHTNPSYDEIGNIQYLVRGYKTFFKLNSDEHEN